MRLDHFFSLFYFKLIQLLNLNIGYIFSGLVSERATPVPIPNTEVKPFSADGTARAAVWESRTRPDSFLKPSLATIASDGFFCALHALS